ncbi:MAG: cell division protein FtsX [Betaproteobacteria bacterium]
MSALTGHRYAVRRALAMVRDRPLTFLLGVALAALALALPLSAASVLWAARPALAQVQPAPELSVFVSTRATPRDVAALQARLASLPGVAGVTLQSKDAALARLIKRSGFVTTPAELGANPLPDVLIAQLELPVSERALDGVIAMVKDWPLVDSVRSDLDWYRKVRALGRLGTTALTVFGGLAVLLVTLILLGAVRLHAGTRADEVAVLKLVGAMPRFIVRPYAYSAALTLALASVLAIAATFAAHAALRSPVGSLAALYGVPFTLPDPDPVHLLVVFAGAVVLGWLVGLVGARAVTSGR